MLISICWLANKAAVKQKLEEEFARNSSYVVRSPYGEEIVQHSWSSRCQMYMLLSGTQIERCDRYKRTKSDINSLVIQASCLDLTL